MGLMALSATYSRVCRVSRVVTTHYSRLSTSEFRAAAHRLLLGFSAAAALQQYNCASAPTTAVVRANELGSHRLSYHGCGRAHKN